MNAPAPTAMQFSAATIAIRSDQVPELKKAIREFQNRVLDLVAPVRDGDAVYQLNIQFFPVTRNPGPRDEGERR